MRIFLRLVALSAVCLALSSPASAADESSILLEGATIYVAPEAPPLHDGAVLIRNGKIAAVGSRESVRVPQDAHVVDCKGATLTSGFWNSHVHFIEDKWKQSATAPAKALTSHLQEMLTRYGFAHVFETATFDLEATLALRRRIASGEVAGPTIYTTGIPFVVPNGTPVYLAPLKLPEVSTPGEVERFVREQIAGGADGVKFFAVSPNSRTTLAAMPLALARSAVAAAHGTGKLAFAHPTNVDGVRIAAAAGVDVLVHVSADQLESWDEALVKQMRAMNMALVPTLKLYTWDPARQGASPEAIRRVVAAASQQLREYSRAGGQILFGTDVGYITDYSPRDEYTLMRDAGLSFGQILASLTTAPAQRFGAASRTGRVEVGMDADLVILNGDPAADIASLADVRRVYAKGRLIYSAQ